MIEFIPTNEGVFVHTSEIVEISTHSEEASLIRTRSNATHVVNIPSSALAADLTLKSNFVIPAQRGYRVVEALCADESKNKWGFTETPVIGWNSIKPCRGAFDVFTCAPVVAGSFGILGPWALVYPDGRVATKNVMYYKDVNAWLKDVKKYGKNRDTM